MIELLVATANPHKLGEIRAMLGSAYRCFGLRDFPTAPSIIEDADSFDGNARKKAVGLACWLFSQGKRSDLKVQWDLPVHVLADDSGLEVDYLHGAPGVHSARYASRETALAGNSPDVANNAKLLGLLSGVEPGKRTARFRCVLALTPVPRPESPPVEPPPPDWEGLTSLFEGTCEGHIGEVPRGKGGFGYDPLFLPAGYTQTFAELGESVKNQLSHRARALAKLKEHFAGLGDP